MRGGTRDGGTGDSGGDDPGLRPGGAYHLGHDQLGRAAAPKESRGFAPGFRRLGGWVMGMSHEF